MSTLINNSTKTWKKALKEKHNPIFISLNLDSASFTSKMTKTKSCAFCVLIIKQPDSSLIFSSVNNTLFCTYHDTDGISLENYTVEIILHPNKGRFYLRIMNKTKDTSNDIYIFSTEVNEEISIVLAYQLNNTTSIVMTDLSRQNSYFNMGNEILKNNVFDTICTLLKAIDYTAYKLHEKNNLLSLGRTDTNEN